MRNPVDALMTAHERLGLPPVNQMPGRKWEGAVGPWRFVVNANANESVLVRGVSVDPFHVYVEYNGWPAGVLDLLGRGQFAAGTGANPKTFAKALAAWDGPSG